jgi:hypothetical protein
MVEPPREAPVAAPDAERETAAERLFFHEDRTLNQRTDWLLVFHSIAMESFFQAASYGRLASLATSIFGLIAALGWARVAYRNRNALRVLRAEYARVSPFFHGPRQGPDERAGVLAQSGLSSPWFTLVIPLATVGIWVVFLAHAVHHCFFQT